MGSAERSWPGGKGRSFSVDAEVVMEDVRGLYVELGARWEGR